jgi:hypothetical protein
MITTKGQKPKFKEENTMTDKHIKQIESQLPAGEQIIKMYKAFEGDIRVITKDKSGYEIRYTCILDENLNVTIKKF